MADCTRTSWAQGPKAKVWVVRCHTPSLLKGSPVPENQLFWVKHWLGSYFLLFYMGKIMIHACSPHTPKQFPEMCPQHSDASISAQPIMSEHNMLNTLLLLAY